MRLSKPIVALAAIFALLLSLFAAPLAAQSTAEDGSDFEVLRVDMSGNSGLVAFRPQQNAGDDPTFTAIIGGNEVVGTTAPLSSSPIAQQIALVVDNSATADTVSGYSQIRSAALAYLDTVPAGTEVMLVLAGEGSQEVRPQVAFTTNHTSIREELSASAVGSAAVTWNAIETSARAFDANGIRNVVVFAGSSAETSGVSPAIAQGALLSADASLSVVGPEIANLDLSAFRSITNSLRGGVFLRGSGDVDMAAAGGVLGDLHRGTLVGRFDTAGSGGREADV